MMKMIYLSLGSNLGRREHNLEEAFEKIQNRIGRLEGISRIYETESWGFSSAKPFYNCCISLRSNINPLRLMELLLEIEHDMGRLREGKGYGDRLIDIDLLLYGDIQLDLPGLKVPHPSMGDRKFVLAPLAEIAPDLIHPVAGISISRMLDLCSDPSEVQALPET
jgi:2-amino-4-hydroxy-6-hydroxymethyldihydropteridine diphosphokinase